MWESERDAWRAGPRTAARLALAEARLLARRPGTRYDAVVVGYPGHLDLVAARRAARGAPVVFDPLVSLSDTFVGDRGRFRAGSPAARALAAIDRRALRAADVVVADTAAHAAFFEQLGGIAGVRVCFVGADERVFRPAPRASEFTHALFVGKLIPLHGVETILDAARLAPDVRFRVVGSGQLASVLARRPPNVEHVAWVDYELLGEEYVRAGVALGVFGTSEKAARVIPNKAFQALASGAPLVTADTAAARELLTGDEDALLVPAGDPRALADAVVRVAEDDALRARIGVRGLETYRQRAGEDVLGRCWRAILEQAA